MRAVGIDVGVRKGLDLVILDDELKPVRTRAGMRLEELEALLGEWEAQVVAIDSPPAWGTAGGSRQAERALRAMGLQSFGTPSADRGQSPFYEWMRVGFRTFEVAHAAGFPRYRAGRPEGTAIEVFPYASAVVLAGGLRPPGFEKARWRTSVLLDEGVDVRELRTIDQVDAAIAALTGIRALQGWFTAVGDPDEGVIVLPAGRWRKE